MPTLTIIITLFLKIILFNKNNLKTILQYDIVTITKMDLKELEEFMLYKQREREPVAVTVVAQTPSQKADPKPEQPTSYSDLFWCFYVIINGEFNYETLANHNSVTQTNLRINYVTKVREKKNKLKGKKLSTLDELETNLANDKNINLNTFLSLCIVEDLNVIYVDNNKKIYLECLDDMCDRGDIIFVFHNEGKYSFCKDNNMNGILKDKYFHIYKIDKPLKAISSYKVDELVNIFNKVCGPNTDTSKFKKSDYYDKILMTILK